MKSLLLLLLLFNFTSCLTLYRLNLGISGKNTDFRSSIENSSGNKKERKICIKKGSGRSTQKCGDGVGSYEQPASLYPSVEFSSDYFGRSNWGYSLFLDYNETDTILLSYPFDGDETEFKSLRYSINPYVFYNFGDRVIKNEKGASFRLGFGPSINYIPYMYLKRRGTDESFTIYDSGFIGANIFIEANYNWFTLRVMNSIVYYEGTKFDNAPNDTLQVDSVSVGFYYSLYVGDLF